MDRTAKRWQSGSDAAWTDVINMNEPQFWQKTYVMNKMGLKFVLVSIIDKNNRIRDTRR
jgi:hypothetical protein